MLKNPEGERHRYDHRVSLNLEKVIKKKRRDFQSQTSSLPGVMERMEKEERDRRTGERETTRKDYRHGLAALLAMNDSADCGHDEGL